jgi:murein DD-endopeptidase MepM/ murein hydrolase activator NlpD
MISHVIRVAGRVARSAPTGMLALALTLGAATVVGAEPVTVELAAEAGTAAERMLVTGPRLLFPIAPTPRCEVLNNFGGASKTFGAGGHQGVDIGANLRQEVYAVEDGVLYRQFTDLGSAAGYGWGLLGNSDTKYRYYHLAGFADGLRVGDVVHTGDLIGFVGDTGNAAPGGWHLHFEVHPGPDPYTAVVDPVPLLAIPSSCTVYPKQG